MEGLPSDFIKLEGCGNSFIVLYCPERQRAPSIRAVRLLLSTAFSVGADGLIIVKPSDKADFSLDLYNRDGSLMGMCGNGSRCVCRFVVLSGLVNAERESLNLEVGERVVACRLKKEGSWSEIDLGRPVFEPALVPVKSEAPLISSGIRLEGAVFQATVLSMGNPHCVIFTEDLSRVDVEGLGARLEKHELFPERANIGFAEVVNREELKLKVWERGVGLTLACGSGACAAVAAGVKNGLLDRRVAVSLPGGVLQVNWNVEDDHMYLAGPAAEVMRGRLFDSFWEYD